MLSRRDEFGLLNAMRDSQNYLTSRRDTPQKSKSPFHRALQAIEVGAGAAGVGFLAGRLGTTNIGNSGVPLGLAVGAGGYALSLLGIFGGWDDHIQNVSDGAISGWLTMWAAGQGARTREVAGGGVGPIVAGNTAPGPVIAPSPAGMPPQYARAPQQMGYGNPWSNQPRQPLSEHEMAAMSRNMRRAA